MPSAQQMNLNTRTFRVVIHQDEEGTYIAEIPTLTHCISYGETMEEAMFNIREAAEGVLAVMQEEGIPIKDDSSLIEYSLTMPVSAGVAFA
jgi:antitoxin HicB